jgi:non-homologous end joining protein Ku
MEKSQKVALAKFVMRGKESIVLIRPSQDGLMLHTMYFSTRSATSTRSTRAPTPPSAPASSTSRSS